MLKKENSVKALDPDFGSERQGYEILVAGESQIANSVRVGPDGRIYSAFQSGSDYGIAVLTEAGILDSSFGIDGIVTGSFSKEHERNPASNGQSIVFTEDGKIILIGDIYFPPVVGNPESYPALARFDTAGVLDSEFGMSGHLILNAPFQRYVNSTFPEVSELHNSSTGTFATSINIQSKSNAWWDTRIYLVHPYALESQGAFFAAALLIVLDTDGNMAPEFNAGQPLIVGRERSNTAIFTLYAEEDLILLGGLVQPDQGASRGAFFRYNVDGSPHEGYGKQGKDWDEGMWPYSLTRRDDNSFLAAGFRSVDHLPVRGACVAINTDDGSKCDDFNGGSTLISDFAQSWNGVATQLDGKLLFVGKYAGAGVDNLVCSRMTAAGMLDPTYVGTGWEVFPQNVFRGGATGVSIQTSKARMLVSGWLFREPGMGEALIAAFKL